MRLAQQRRILSPEALARIIAGSKGRVATDAARAKMRAARLGKKRPLEVGAKISATLRARFLRLKEQRG